MLYKRCITTRYTDVEYMIKYKMAMDENRLLLFEKELIESYEREPWYGSIIT